MENPIGIFVVENGCEMIAACHTRARESGDGSESFELLQDFLKDEEVKLGMEGAEKGSTSNLIRAE